MAVQPPVSGLQVMPCACFLCLHHCVPTVSSGMTGLARDHQNALSAQARLDKEDLRIEVSVAALRKQRKKAVKQAADLEVSLGKSVMHVFDFDHH